IEDQARTPTYPTGNYNHIQFPEVTGSQLRITVTHLGTERTGIKELQVFGTGVTAPTAENAAPQVRAHLGPDSVPGNAQLVGTVRDDARPTGELSYRWTVADAPEDATVIFTDAEAASTAARYSAPGTYV